MNADPDLHFLEHPTRRRIVEHLRVLPGDHFRSIVRSLHLSVGTARYHLTALAKKGFVRSERMGDKLRYFATARGSKPPLNETYKQYWKYRDLRARVWLAVLRLPQVRPSSVARSLGVRRQLAAYHLNRLAELGLVTRAHGRYSAVVPGVPERSSPEAASATRAGSMPGLESLYGISMPTPRVAADDWR